MRLDMNKIVSAVEAAEVSSKFDTTEIAQDGMYPGRIRLMAQMLDEVINNTWVPSGDRAIADGIFITGPVEFDLSHWQVDVTELVGDLQWELDEGDLSEDRAQRVECRIEELQAKPCGFAACAVGHACYDSRFNDIGLTLSDEGDAPMLKDSATDDSWGNLTSWTAVRKFFGIKNCVAEWLFQAESYEFDKQKSPAAVRDRCLELAEKGQVEIVKQMGYKPEDLWGQF